MGRENKQSGWGETTGATGVEDNRRLPPKEERFQGDANAVLALWLIRSSNNDLEIKNSPRGIVLL